MCVWLPPFSSSAARMYSFSTSSSGRTVPRVATGIGKRLADLLGQVLELDATSARERDGALHGVLELAHVARPLVAQELIGGARGEARDLALHPQRRVREQHPGERQDVVPALAQRRHVQLDDLEPVVEVLPEGAARDAVGEVAVGGGQDAHVDPPALVLADAPDLPLLQRAQELDLHARRDLADLVQQQRPAVGRLEQARPVLRSRR